MDNEKMNTALTSILMAYKIAKKSDEEISSSNDGEITKIARQSGNCKFILSMLEQDLKLVGLI
jgi:hypothetical protein